MKPNARRSVLRFRSNTRIARRLWGKIPNDTIKNLKELTANYGFCVAGGDLMLLDGRWYVTHAGLLRLADRRRCIAIETSIESQLSNPMENHWVFKAIVYRRRSQKGFSGYGDADPSNVSQLVRGAEMRVAETRAVNRALRKAYGIGLCSVEELGSSARSFDTGPSHQIPPSNNGRNNSFKDGGEPRLRDQLCLLIRQHSLDPTLVKAYAANFCGTQTIKDASRDLVESFISHLAASAKEDRDGLVCKLNSFAQLVEVKQ